jgi:anhydro-N-acetylmuramic acid kinase
MPDQQRPRTTRRQRALTIAGLMSGTSLDGIDAVLLRVRGSGAGVRFRQLAYLERPFPRGMRQMLLRNSVPDTSRVDEIARLNMALAMVYADAVRALVRAARLPLAAVDLVGSHGQTIHHLPAPARVAGRTVRATLQIGDPSALAALTGITTVGDFRVADMARGGQGAPLVPHVDWLIFRSEKENRLVLNIGGIANLTAVPIGAGREELLAFDTGPGNMVVDALVRRLFNRPFDAGGRIAARGAVSGDLLRFLRKDRFLRAAPPKSTGREMYGERYVRRLLAYARPYEPDDIVATASAFTIEAVHDAYRRHIARRMRADVVIVSGGGARNQFFMSELARLFAPARVCSADDIGVSSDAREAITFALLANETLHGLPANLPRVTGADRPVVLGKICPGRNFPHVLFLQ